MSQIEISRNYEEGTALLEADLDAIQTDLTTFFNTTKINDDNIQTGGISESKIVAASVSTAKIEEGAISTSHIPDSNVTTAKINDLAVTTAKINDSAVTTAKLNDLAVTTAKINDSAVTTAKIDDAAVTTAKRAALTTGTGNITTASTSGTSHITHGTVSITVNTANRPIWVGVNSANGSASCDIRLATGTQQVSITYNLQLQFSSDGGSNYTTFWDVKYRSDQGAGGGYVHFPAGGLWAVHTPTTAGSYIYRLRGVCTHTDSGSALTGTLNNLMLYAYEIL